jgi:hypothetical protein
MIEVFVPTLLNSYLKTFRKAFSKSGYTYFVGFIWALMLIHGRKRVTDIANACFFIDKHVSSFERFLSEYKWSMHGVIASLVSLLLSQLGERLMVHGAFLAAADATFVGKASKKMPGVQNWWDHSSNPDRGGYLFGHNWAILGLLSPFRGKWLCFPILARLISGQKNPSHFVSTPEGLRPADFWDVTVSNVLYTWELLGRRALRVVADAYFATANFIKPLMEKGIAIISRLRKNAVGWDDTPEYSGHGRPRKRGKKWKLADLLKECKPESISVHIYGKDCQVTAVTRDVWLRNIPKKVRVVVIEGIKEPVILVCTDLSLNAAQIIEIYAARFALEITIRDLKQHFGFTDYQSTTTIAIFRFVQLCCTAFCVWKLMLLPENASTWLDDVKPKAIKESAFSFARARRGLRQFVIKQIFFNSAETSDFKKIEDEYEPIFRIAA